VYRITPVRAFFAATVWHWLERETGLPDTTGSGKSAPDYKYGKVTGLSPDLLVMTETTESPYVCCGYCSAGMACNVVKPGLSDSMNSVAHPIRSQGGRPHNNGNNAGELRTGAKSAHNITLKSVAISEIKTKLAQGYAVTVGLQYADLPEYLKVQGGDFGHACCLYGIQQREDDDRVGFFDPLYPQGARGAWARWADVKAALWSDGNHSTTTVLYDAPDPAPVPPNPVPVPKWEPDYAYAEASAVAAYQSELLRDTFKWLKDTTQLPAPFAVGDASQVVENAPWGDALWNRATWYLSPNASKWNSAVWAGVTDGGAWV
jgi:hypothetical protein